jgi:hypothetical protein
LVPCVVQPRDVAIVRDIRRYKFLTAPQLRELRWAESSVQVADRRLLKLFRAGYLDRFRSISRRGSFPWTYQLGLEGHRLLQRAGIVGPRERFVRSEVYDYGHVLHDLQLAATASGVGGGSTRASRTAIGHSSCSSARAKTSTTGS